MKGDWKTIRDFLVQFKWATKENICYRIYGASNPQLENDVDWILTRMKQAKKRENRIRQLKNGFDKIYAPPNTTFWHKGFIYLAHDIRLKNVIAKMLHCYPDAEIKLSRPEDAEMIWKGEKFYIEYDTGSEGPTNLAGKLHRNYTKDGAYRVIFIMNNRGCSSNWLEPNRLDLIFKLSAEVLKGKKGRVLGACYSEFLSNGKIYNHRGETWTI